MIREAIFTAALLSATSAFAQDTVGDFYRGKTMTLYVGASAGGGVDLFGRMVAKHLGRFIPGAPNVVVQNVPGAGSLVAAKNLYTLAPKDGTVLATVLPGAFFDPLFSPQPGDSRDKYDPTKFNYVGNGNPEALVCVVRDDAPVKKYEDLFTRELIVGTPGGGSTVHLYSVVMKTLVGAKLKIVTGYPGVREVTLAAQSGEVQGICGVAWTTVKLQFPGSIEGKGGFKVVAQVGATGHPDLDKAGIPLTSSSARDAKTREALDVFYSQGMFSRAFMLPPGVPAERVAAVRKAFLDAIRSPALQEEAEKIAQEAVPDAGETLDTMVKKIYGAPADVIEIKIGRAHV